MDFLKTAIKNISNWGDTDIFPYPMENALFFDVPDQIESLILDFESDIDTRISEYPVDYIKTCIPVGYTGYRWATLIDPIWNCFLLYQVLKISSEIEEARLSIDKKSVFSYRINIDESSGKLFDTSNNWRAYFCRAIELAETVDYKYVVRFDISDFYNRIYHHRLDNALTRIDIDAQIKNNIMRILQDISGNVSYGLPVGGNAARILAEILLNSFDQMLNSKRVVFCRFVDDFILFAKSKEEAFRQLNWCAEYLLRAEGLSLQKSKTQVLTCSEFLSYAKATLEGEEGEKNKERAAFLKLHIHYDPYSTTADDDYEELKDKIKQFDVLGLLKSEIRKSRIHQAVGKQIMNALNFLDGEQLDLAFNVISSNFESLYPVFPSVMQLAIKKLGDSSSATQVQFIDTLYKLLEADSYIIQTDNNASYVSRVLSIVNEEKSVQGIDLLYTKTTSPLVKSNCIYAMINRQNHYWLSDIKSKFLTLSSWERRAFIPGSYYLLDEGKHWRRHTERQFTKLEIIIRDWVSTKNPSQTGWKIPL